jgi:hypothetical protein
VSYLLDKMSGHQGILKNQGEEPVHPLVTMPIIAIIEKDAKSSTGESQGFLKKPGDSDKIAVQFGR